jgi:hypothetical protein
MKLDYRGIGRGRRRRDDGPVQQLGVDVASDLSDTGRDRHRDDEPEKAAYHSTGCN